MDISVVIVCYKGWDHLRKCLDSLGKLSGEKPVFEVIVADNNSADGMLSEFVSTYPEYRFISNSKNGGFAYGCNSGAREAKGEYLLFLNPDTVVRENSLSALLQAAKNHPEVFIMSCMQVDKNGGESRAWGSFLKPGLLTGTGRLLAKLGGFLKEPKKNESNIFFPEWVSGSVMLIKNDVFRRLNGFDEDFWMYYEDMDICRRASEAGGLVAVTCNSEVLHCHGGSSRINRITSSVTKSEVLVSRHIYVEKHLRGLIKSSVHIWLTILNIVSLFIKSVVGTIIFFIPRLSVAPLIMAHMIRYYISVISHGGWTSRRSVRYLSKGE